MPFLNEQTCSLQLSDSGYLWTRVAQKNLFSEKLTSPGEFVFRLGQKLRKIQVGRLTFPKKGFFEPSYYGPAVSVR